MTQRVAIVTDSVACLPRELVEQYRIGIIPLNLLISENVYRDWVDITPTEAYQHFERDPNTFRTSAASPMDSLNVIREAAKLADTVFCVMLSSKLSMQHQSVVTARDLAKEELPGVHIEIMDSGQATSSEGMIALAAARAAADGKGLDEVMQAAAYVRDNVRCFFFLETLRHVYRSGRIPKIASRIGAALNIRPILTVQGTVHFVGVSSSHRHGIERLLGLLRNTAGDKPVRVAVTHAYAPKDAEHLKERITAEFNCAEIWLSEFSPVMGYACGTGTLGISCYTDG